MYSYSQTRSPRSWHLVKAPCAFVRAPTPGRAFYSSLGKEPAAFPQRNKPLNSEKLLTRSVIRVTLKLQVAEDATLYL